MTTLVARPGEVGAGYDDRRRLVVIGNGMAGARVVEEILARGGTERFSITMFGDEPYGNYNRILLSHVLSGEQSHDEIFLNSLEWYVENGITLHAGVRVQRIDRFAQVVLSDDGQLTPYDELIIATGSRSFMPPMDGLHTADGSLLPGVFPFRTIDDTRGMIDYATRDDHHRAVVIGGGLLGLEAARGLQSHGIEVDVIHSGRWLMNAQLGREGGKCYAEAWLCSESASSPTTA
jgi:nitrite reductase (NADH) large subunit